jgi:hypothetical protein
MKYGQRNVLQGREQRSLVLLGHQLGNDEGRRAADFAGQSPTRSLR